MLWKKHCYLKLYFFVLADIFPLLIIFKLPANSIRLLDMETRYMLFIFWAFWFRFCIPNVFLS